MGATMKRLLSLAALIALLLMPVCAWAVTGTIVPSYSPGFISIGGQPARLVLTLTCTGAADNGSFPATGNAIINPDTLKIRGWYLYSVEFKYGTTTPNAYSIKAVDSLGNDKLKSALLTRTTASASIVYMGSVGYPTMNSNWTWTITGNSTASAVIVCELTFVSN